MDVCWLAPAGSPQQWTFCEIWHLVSSAPRFEGASVRVRRPNDYNPAMAATLGPSTPNPNLNLAVIGLSQPGAVADGPDRIFVGGLPYYLTEEQCSELLGKVASRLLCHKCIYHCFFGVSNMIAGAQGIVIALPALCLTLALPTNFVRDMPCTCLCDDFSYFSHAFDE